MGRMQAEQFARHCARGRRVASDERGLETKWAAASSAGTGATGALAAGLMLAVFGLRRLRRRPTA